MKKIVLTTIGVIATLVFAVTFLPLRAIAGLETPCTYISDLVSTNPLSSDLASTSDDHHRCIKLALKTTLPNVNGAVTSTDEELNIVDGVTATAAEINALDGITATVTELNYTDGVTSAIQTQLDAKLASSSYTAADVLTKLLTVDGAGSGLDADLWDGSQPSAVAFDLVPSGTRNLGSSANRWSTVFAGSIQDGAATEQLVSSSSLTAVFSGGSTWTTGSLRTAGVERIGYSASTINLQATSVQVNGSTIQSAALQRIARMRNTNSGAGCTIASDSGITSCTHSSTGSYAVDFTAAGFTAEPVCVAAPASSVVTSIAGISAVTSTTATVTTGDDIGGVANRLWNLICMGT